MKGYYRIMLGKKSIHATECYKGNFIGVDFLIDSDLTGALPDDWRVFNQKFIPYGLKNIRANRSTECRTRQRWSGCWTKAMVRGCIICVVDEEDDMERFALKNSGSVDLRFEGEKLGESSQMRRNGKKQDHWHRLSLYRAKGGSFVLAIEYHEKYPDEWGSSGYVTRIGQELIIYFAEFLYREEIIAKLRDYDATKYVSEQDQQVPLLNDIAARFQSSVTDILDLLNEAQ